MEDFNQAKVIATTSGEDEDNSSLDAFFWFDYHVRNYFQNWILIYLFNNMHLYLNFENTMMI